MVNKLMTMNYKDLITIFSFLSFLFNFILNNKKIDFYMLYFEFFKMTLNYKNKETLYDSIF